MMKGPDARSLRGRPPGSGLRTLLFDLGNVVVRFSHQRMFRQMAAVTGLEPETIAELVMGSDGINDRLERGLVSDDELYGVFAERAPGGVPRNRLEWAASDIFWSDPLIEDLIRRIKARGLRLVLISNTCALHVRHVQKYFPVVELFDEAILSYEVGARKPEGAIFEAALEVIECTPGECFFTDDVEEYVSAAREYGLQGAPFTSAQRLERDLREHGLEL